MIDIAITFAILGVIVALFISNKVPVGIVAIGAALSLWATGVLDLTQVLAGFGDPAVLFIASLFVVSEGLDATGVTAWAGQQLIDRAGESRTRLIVYMMLLVALLTALISVNGAVAALLPVVVVMAVRLGRPPSQLLMPLVFGAHAGSLLALTGTPVHVLVTEAVVKAGEPGFGFFEFALAGIPLMIGSVLIVVLFGEKLLPNRSARSMPADLSKHARTLVEQYRLEDGAVEGPLFTRTSGLAEVIIPPRSDLVGTPAFPGMVTDSGDLIVLAVQRQGENLGPEETTLAVGDTLLLEGTWDAFDENLADPEVLVINSPDLVRRQAVPLGKGAKTALAILAGMVVALATGVVPTAVAGLVAACLMVLLRVLSTEGAYRAISWTTVVLVAGMIPLSTAMTETGAADLIAEKLVGVVGPAGPYALLAGLFVLTLVFSQLISNMATALIVIPIALAAAGDLGLSVRPVMMSITIAAAAAYLTPVATPVNMMVMGPAGYKFGDYWKLGLPLAGLSFVVSVFLVPLIWPF